MIPAVTAMGSAVPSVKYLQGGVQLRVCASRVDRKCEWEKEVDPITKFNPSRHTQFHLVHRRSSPLSSYTITTHTQKNPSQKKTRKKKTKLTYKSN